MATLKLTKRAIDGFKYEGVEFKDESKCRDVRWDATLPGFGVRTYPTGRKAFLLSYRVRGRKRMMAIGNIGTLTLEQARSRARKLLVQAQDGRDPLELRRKAAQGKTFGDLTTAYIERHAKVHKRTWQEDQRRLRTHPPAAWKGRLAASITRKEIADLHGRIGATKPYEANRFLETLQKMFSLAGIWGFIDETAPDPSRGIQRFRERQRKRWLKPEELPRLAKAIDSERNIYMRAAFWLYPLTGVRKSELLQARWDDIDWNRGRLRLPNTKSGDEQSATLNAPALAILQSIPKLDGNPFVLPGKKPERPLRKIDKAWGRNRALIAWPQSHNVAR